MRQQWLLQGVRSMGSDLYLTIDIGTGSVRAALVDGAGTVLHIASREHEQIVPAFGWSEQRPADWWAGVVHVVRAAIGFIDGAAARIAAVCACGQNHGTVLIDASGALTRAAAPLWNDKRTTGLVAAFEAKYPTESYLADSGNPPATAWPAFKLQWLRDNDRRAYDAASTVLMPKDYVNFRLTGERAMDLTSASLSFMMNPTTNQWSPAMLERLGLDPAMLPPIRLSGDVLGQVTAAAAEETGLPEGLPVLVGAGDFPTALLGSGASRPGLGSEVMGTSSIIVLMSEQPILHPEICNIIATAGLWANFVLLECGGDAMRWARRAFHRNTVSYDEITDLAAEAPAGADGLFFLPYLGGERLGKHRNARAQFFGLTASHGLAHLHRAVLEGVAFGVTRHLRIMEHVSGRRIEHIVASGGGARAKLWLRIKASAYGIPILVPHEPECGVIGCAAIAATATGRFSRLADALAAFVHYDEEIAPDPAWADRYRAMQGVFERIYRHSQDLYDSLDTLT
jgi:xylulokinase